MTTSAEEPVFEMSDAQMEGYALNYLKECKPQEYRELRKSGELDGHIAEKVEACRRYALSLINDGTFANQAWHWAVRVKLLDSPMD